MKTIFVSYSQPDEKIGASVVSRLKKETFVVWFAPEQLEPGDSFMEIFDQIDNCDAFIVLLSRNSAKSPWVNKELDVAITRQLSDRPLLLIPAYLEPMGPLRKVADLKAVDLREGWLAKGLKSLVSQLHGEEENSEASHQSFEHFLNNLVRISDAKFQIVDRVLSLSSMFEPDTHTESADTKLENQMEVNDRVLDNIGALLSEATVSKQDCARVLEAVKCGIELPIVNRFHLSELRRFSRRSNEVVVKLSGEFWQMRGMRGVTLRWFEDWLSSYLRENFSIEDEELLNWKIESLIDQARAAGLLVSSTETPVGYGVVDAEHNPSYDFGPMVNIAGRLVAAFTSERQRLLTEAIFFKL